MSAIPTVKIRAGDSYGVINLCDFDPDRHKIWLDEAELEVHELSELSELLRTPPTEPETGTASDMPPDVLNLSTCGTSASMVYPADPPSAETITEPPATPAVLAPEPVKQYRPGQFTPKRGPGRPRKE